MSTVISVLAAAERYWLIGVLIFIAGALVLAATVEAIKRRLARR